MVGAVHLIGRVLAAAQAPLTWRLANHDRALANMSVGEGGLAEWLPEGRSPATWSRRPRSRTTR